MPRAVVLEVAAHQRAFAADAVQDVTHDTVGVVAHLPTVPLFSLEPLEAVPPVGEPLERDQRGVVGPVLEEPPVGFQQVRQRRRSVIGEARGEDQVVRAIDDVDRVHLDEAEAAVVRSGGLLAALRREPAGVAAGAKSASEA